MNDRYRIIEHRDDNGVAFYTIRILNEWFFGIKFWSTLKSYSPDGSPSTFRMFDTAEEARKFIRGTKWTTTVIEEGVI